jgi:hypothetical protein
MRPAFTSDNLADSHSVDSKTWGELLLEIIASRKKAADFQNLMFSQLGARVLFSTWTTWTCCAMKSFIQLIFTCATPAKIRKFIVGPVAVQVPTLLPRGTRTDKGQQYQAMDKYLFHDHVIAKFNLGIPMTVLIGSQHFWFFASPPSTAVQGSSTTMGGNFIQRITRHLFPDFLRHRFSLKQMRPWRPVYGCDTVDLPRALNKHT